MNVINLIKNYYDYRDLKWPNFDQAMKFVLTEIGEVFEVDLNRPNNGWVRNNPQDKHPYSKEKMAEELGDVIFMLLVAGIVEDVNPLEAMVNKMNKKMKLDGYEAQEAILLKELGY